MVDFKLMLTEISRGSFPSDFKLQQFKVENRSAFKLLIDNYYQYLLFNTLNEKQSRGIIKFIRKFYKELDYYDQAVFINLTIIRSEIVTIGKIVRLLSFKNTNRCGFFIKSIGMLAETRTSDFKVVESLIQYTFQEFREEREQKGIIDYLAGTLSPKDFLKAMIFCRDLIVNKNYLELSCWSALRDYNFTKQVSIDELIIILPRLTFSTIREIGIMSDLSKHLRMFQTEINKTHSMITAVEKNIRTKLEYLHNNPTDQPPTDSSDLMDFYQNYQYGVK